MQGCGAWPALCGARRGFTTIELLIALVVLAVLVALAYPSYQAQIRKSRRAEAFTELTRIQQLQERHRSNFPAFASSLTDAVTATPPGLAQSTSVTPSGYYNLVLSDTSSTGYTLTANAVSGTSQFNDGDCAKLAVKMNGGTLQYGSGATIDWTDSKRCWAR